MFQKRVPPKIQTTVYLQARRLLETTPRVRIFNNKNNSLDNNSSNYSNNCKNLLLMFSFCSKLLLEFSYLSKCLFDFGLKTERMFDLLHLLEHKAHDLTRPGQRPGEFPKLDPQDSGMFHMFPIPSSVPEYSKHSKLAQL